MNDVEFQDLLGRVRKGDTDAWSCLIDLLDPIIRVAVRGQATWRQGQRQTDDNVQSVLLLCWQQNWPARLVGRSFREAIGYVRRAAINVLLKHIRAAERERSLRVDGDVEAMCADLTKPVEETVVGEEEYHLLLAAIKAECRSDSQFVAAQRLLEGEGYQVVAGDLGMTPEALGAAWRRLLARVRKRLEAINHD